MNPFRFFDPFAGLMSFLSGPRLCIGGLFNKSDASTKLETRQVTIDASAAGAGATTFTAGGDKSRQDFDFRTGYTEGNSKIGNVTGSENLIIGTGGTYQYVEQLSDDVVFRALDSVDSTTANAFAFADDAVGRAASALQSSVTISDAAARRSAEFADAARLTIERVADPAGSASRTILYVVAGLVAVALFLFRPRKSKA